MDIFTHALSGALISRAGRAKTSNLPVRVTMLAGAISAIVPELVILISHGLGSIASLRPNNDWLHSLVLFPVWVVILAFLFTRIWRQYHWREFVPVCGLSFGLNLFLNAATAQGIPLLLPFADFRLALGFVYYFDIYISSIIVLSLILLIFFRKHAQQISLAGVVFVLFYIVGLNYLQRSALQQAYEFVPVEKGEAYKVYALAQPWTPFRWKLIIEKQDRVYLQYIDLEDKQNRMNWRVAYKMGDPDQKELVLKILKAPSFRALKKQMILPVVYDIETEPGMDCVWFVDEAVVTARKPPTDVVGGCELKANDEIRIYHLEEGQKVLISE